MSLRSYNKKRDFSKTLEPVGKRVHSKKRLRYLIQYHEARKKHYDLRLEYNGVYISFAVPKGPSFNPKDKRLAVHVEDHPISYGNFEGCIPKGEYGGGTVMLFDKGFYTLKEKPDFNKSIKFHIDGIRLKGDFALIHFKDDNWLLIKEKDELVNKNNVSKYKTSVVSNRTIKEIESNLDNIEITHPDKVIYSLSGVTKSDIVNYYKYVSTRMLCFLNNRLISVVRSTNNNKFFMKHLNNKYLGTKKVNNHKYNYIKDINGLISEVQMNSYEFHIWNSNIKNINKPDIIVFDFDPDSKVDLNVLRDCVLELKGILDKLKLKCYLKTSGKKGYHVYVPIRTRSYKECVKISESIAKILVSKNEFIYTLNIRKKNRKNKIFIDYFRNKKGATSVCPYSLRLNDKPSISCPIKWSELYKIKPDDITIFNIKDRLKLKDPWGDFFE